MKNRSFMTMLNIKGSQIDKDEFPQPTPKVELHGRKVMLCGWVESLQYYSF